MAIEQRRRGTLRDARAGAAGYGAPAGGGSVAGSIGDARASSALSGIAYGTGALGTPRSIVTAWMNSPGHRANILDSSYRETGLGAVAQVPASLSERQSGGIYTQDFGAHD